MALHINDIVSIERESEGSERVFYRVQKLAAGNKKFVLRVHIASNDIYLKILPDLSLIPNLVCCKTSSAVFFLVVFMFDCKTLTRHGDKWKFLMALHINDIVSIERESEGSERVFYRVQKLAAGNKKFV
jgi:DNA-directed RNA polymerase subunit H (RpoH/RPB5)